MAKITDRADLNVGTELIINEPNRTIELVVAGNLVAKDGVIFQALYSKLVDLWATTTYQDSPFPVNALDALSGQYIVGMDAGGNANGWKFLNDATRQKIRDGGWEEYNASGTLERVYAGIVGLGSVNSGAQLYYQKESGGTASNFTFSDQCNEAIQVYGNASNGDFDNRTYFKTFVREQGKKFSDSVLADTGKTATGAYIVNMLLSNEDDLIIADDDSEMTNAPYNGINIEYFATNQNRDIGGTNYPFKIIVDGNNATLEQIYTKLQYLLRQGTDIDTGTGTVIGKTANTLASFTGDTLETSLGVYIDNIKGSDSNRIKFKDQNGIVRENPYTAAGEMNFNAIMVGAGSSYRLMFSANYGTSSAVTVKDSAGADITGVISSGSVGFDFDYDNDTLGGTAGTDKAVTLIGIRKNSSKFAVATGMLTRSKGISLSLVAETDRAYN